MNHKPLTLTRITLALATTLAAGLAQAQSAPRHLSIDDDTPTVQATTPDTAATTLPIDTTNATDAHPAPAVASDGIAPPNSAAQISTANAPQDPTQPTQSTDTATGDSTDNTDATLDTPDPYEQTNRKLFEFNEAVDNAAVKPVAKAYQKVIPNGVRRCASNAFDNIDTPYTAVNNILQGKIKSAGQDVGRLLVNTTIGLGGCFDVATVWGIPKHDEDFGQTLGVWGVPSGAFVMLPGYGPSSVRDALAKPVDIIADPIGFIRNVPLRYGVDAYSVLNKRTNLLEVTDMVDESALDKYSMVRDAWLQRREARVQDTDGSYDDVPTAKEGVPRAAGH